MKISIFHPENQVTRMNIQTNINMTDSELCHIDLPLENSDKIEARKRYRQNILTKTREAQERVDRLLMLMYQRFINETEDWDD